jgi:hypothetical protein
LGFEVGEEMIMKRKFNRELFIRKLAEFLVGNEIEMSVKLQMGKPEAKVWADLRNATPLFGDYCGEEGLARAEQELAAFLFGRSEE